MGDATRITVDGAALYDVVIGTDLWNEVPPLLGAHPRRIAVIHQASVTRLVETLRAQLSTAGLEVHPIDVPDGEQAKTLDVTAQCWARLGAHGITRTDAVVAIGGGAVTDLAGFVAATWLRGVRVLHLPTTVLGMVDAAIGGKTGINMAAGKNLVGAVYPPAGVLCDLSSLATLSRWDVVTGLAEVVKCGFIADPQILGLIEADPSAAADPANPVLRELIERAVGVKARIVAADLYERATHGVGRLALNYGHTLAHAIEAVEGYTWRHGAAVSVGLAYAAELGRLAGHLDPAICARHRTALDSLGLPTSYRADAWPQLRAAMSHDKKSQAGRLRFVVLDGLAQPVVLDDPPEALLADAFRCLR